MVMQINKVNHKPRLPDEPQIYLPLTFSFFSPQSLLHCEKKALPSPYQPFLFEVRGKRSVPQIDIPGRHYCVDATTRHSCGRSVRPLHLEMFLKI